MRLGRNALAAGLVVGMTPLLSLALPGTSARADTSFEAFAQSFGVQATMANASFPLGLTAEINVPFSSAHLNRLQQSDATASSLYPGDVVAGLPGLAGALISLPTPRYPIIVTTQYGEDPKSTVYPGASMSAESAEDHAFAKGQVGADPSGSTSTSRVQAAGDGSVVATAESTLDGVVLGDQLKLSGLQTRVQVLADSAGKLTRTSSISIGRLNVPGLRMRIPCTTPESAPLFVPVPGVPQPPPQKFPPVEIPPPFGCSDITDPDIGFKDGSFFVSLPTAGTPTLVPVAPQTVFEAFKAAGIEASFQPQIDSENGLTGVGFVFRTVLPEAPDNQYFKGTTPVTFTVGQGLATVDLQPVVGFGAGASGLSPAGSPGVATGTGTAAVGALPDAAGLGAGALPGTVPPVGGAFPTANGGTLPTQTFQPATSVASYYLGGSDTADNIYIALVCTAVIAFAATSVMRVLGVGFRWNS